MSTSHTTHYGPHVRVINNFDPFAGEDLTVERKVGDTWERVYGTNSMSNDWAYTETARIAQRTATQMALLEVEKARGAA
ncbi:hypothetical protein UFOVP707_81 [uncultured Caudovirales phage]|uniref:Uncharacterized protein n=1 Tax=uncultured Caudovirales phage TaxID=2100421 RepID=A0A6J5NJ22_9CAUD|nr:hypothetical protein UFOVP707_81 [uncultured Caudovirales phage]